MCAVTASFRIFFAAVTHAVVVRFSEDPDFVRDLVHLGEDLEENAAGVSSDPLARVRRAVWGMLYANDAGIVSKSADGLAKMMTVIATVFEAAGLTVSEKKTETMLLRIPDQAPCWGMLYADDAGIVSKSAEGLAKMIAIIVTVSPCPRRRRRPCCCGHRIRYPGRHPSSSNQQARDIDRQRC